MQLHVSTTDVFILKSQVSECMPPHPHVINSDGCGLRAPFFPGLQEGQQVVLVENLHSDVETIGFSYILNNSIKLETVRLKPREKGMPICGLGSLV